MSEELRLMCILAHPDDESLGFGGILSRYADEGVHTHLVTATRGERGWMGPDEAYPGPEALGRIREEELRSAAEVLGLREVHFLGYEDGLLDQAEPEEAVARIVSHLRQMRPDVVVTFGPDGAYGHPDHIAICQLTTAAVVAAADDTYAGRDERPAHRVSKLYYRAETEKSAAAYEAAFGELVMRVDGQSRRLVSWEPWAITTQVNTEAYADQIWQAIACHRSQLSGYEALRQLPEKHRRNLWATQSFYRTLSFANGGRIVEDDLFAGLRAATAEQHASQPVNALSRRES